MTNNWQTYKLSEICEIISGGTPNTSIAEYWNGNIFWLSVKDFNTDSKYVYKSEKTITELGLKNSSTNILQKGDIIISARGTVGELAMIPYDMAFNQSCYGLRVKEMIKSNFLYYLLKNNINILKNNTHGSVFDTITRNTFDDIEISLPPLDVQRRIAGVLGALDDKIELNNKINQNLDLQAQTLFNKYFPNIFSGEKCIGNYISPIRGKNLLSKDAVIGDVPVIAGGLQPATYHNVANTVAPVITISASGANAGFVNLWHIPVWSSDSSFIDSSMNPYVYFWYVMLKLRQKEIFDSQTGSAQPHIYPQHIERLPLSDLDMKKVKEYNEIISSLFEKIGYNVKENDILSKLRDTLLPKLMSGEIKV